MSYVSQVLTIRKSLGCRLARSGWRGKKALLALGLLITLFLIARNHRGSIKCARLSCITLYKPKKAAVCPRDRAVLVRGVRSGSTGLGNTLFQVATAVYYAETFGFDVFLDSSSPTILWGTSSFTNRDQARKGRDGARLSYLESIFSSKKLRTAPLNRCTMIDSNHGTIKTVEDRSGSRELRDPAADGRRVDADGSALLPSAKNSDALVVVHNDYTGNVYKIPERPSSQGPENEDEKSRTRIVSFRRASERALPSPLILEISGYCQNISLFLPVLDVLPDYLALRDAFAESKLREKYGLGAKWKTRSASHERSQLLGKQRLSRGSGSWLDGVEATSRAAPAGQRNFLNTNILVGVRWGSDFSHMKKVTMASYERALDHLLRSSAPQEIGRYSSSWKLVVLADVEASQLSGFQDLATSLSQRHATPVEVVIVQEDDVTQLQAGLVCDRFVLSESTFHLWIALLRTGLGRGPRPRLHAMPPSNVVVFEDTDVTTRGLVLEGWTRLPY